MVAWMVHEGMAHGAASCLTLAGVARRAKVLPNPANRGVCILYIYCILYFGIGASRMVWMVHEGMAHGAASCLTLGGVARRAKVLPNPANRGVCILYIYCILYFGIGASRMVWMVHEGMAHGAASCLTLGGVARRAKVLPNPANMCQHYLTPPLPRIGPAPVQKGLNRRFCNIYGYTNS